jgi:hypothetical protein
MVIPYCAFSILCGAIFYGVFVYDSEEDAFVSLLPTIGCLLLACIPLVQLGMGILVTVKLWKKP